MNCINCNKETNNPKFCSRSCSTSHNNRLNPRRKKTKKCANCNNLVLSQRRHCEECKHLNYTNWSTKTIEDIHGKASYQISAHIRQRARHTFRKNHPSPTCFVCGYDKHVEVCHIKAISSYPKTTSIAEVNDISNLIGLCPNHHWEFDNNCLDIPL